MNVDAEMFSKIGLVYTKTKSNASQTVKRRRFNSFCGVSPSLCSVIWNEIVMKAPLDAKPQHLLWCLNFLKQYTVEHTRQSIFEADEKTIRKWTWTFVELLANLNVIHWENRFDAAAQGQTCFCSLDGVDFKILEPTPFDRRWYSHKFKSAGLRYEIGLNIRTGDIVWKNGGYPCGAYPDLKLARESYVLSVHPGETTLADKGYNDKTFFILPNTDNNKMHKRIMSRHETINKRIRHFQILKQIYRNSLTEHPIAFHAVLHITQLIIKNEEPLFSVF